MNAGIRVNLVAVVCILRVGPSFAQSESRHYGLQYDLTLKPAEDRAEVSLTIDERMKDNISSMRFHIDPNRHTGFTGDGAVEAAGNYVTWTPPVTGGRLSFQVPVNS